MRGEPDKLTAFLVIAAFAAALFTGAPATAQDLGPSRDVQVDLEREQTQGVDPSQMVSEEDFHALVDGRTVYFELEDGSLWGREYYIRGTNRTVFEFTDGECYNGDWRKEGPFFCYYYLEQPSCWLTYYEGDRLTVLSRGGARQRVRKITDETLSCDADLLSLAPDQAPLRDRDAREEG